MSEPRRPYYDKNKKQPQAVPVVVVTTLILDPISKAIKVTETLLNIRKKP